MDKSVFLYWPHTPSTEYWQHCSCWFHQYCFKSHCSNAYSVLLYQCDVIETSMRNSTKVCRRSFRRGYSVHDTPYVATARGLNGRYLLVSGAGEEFTKKPYLKSSPRMWLETARSWWVRWKQKTLRSERLRWLLQTFLEASCRKDIPRLVRSLRKRHRL